jgi:hypothetical protein
VNLTISKNKENIEKKSIRKKKKREKRVKKENGRERWWMIKEQTRQPKL